MLEIKNLHFSYDNKSIFNNLNVSLEMGKIYFIMGKSGIGKTTLLRLLSGLESSNKGKIDGFGNAKKSYLFQENRLIPWLTVFENIKLIENDDKKIVKALKTCGIYEERDSLPDSLSGGMQRRAALARCIAANGDIYFIDEPFTGLDVSAINDMTEALKATLGGKTAFIISHNAEDAINLGDKLILIDKSPADSLKILDIKDFSSAEEINALI